MALCVDLSFSMVHDGRWGPMKQTALALNHLIETRFRQDALQVIGFNRLARRMTPVQLAEVEPDWMQGTNLQHALLLAAPSPAPSSGGGAGRAGDHRRRANCTPHRGERRLLPLADDIGDTSGNDRAKWMSSPATAPRSTRSCSGRSRLGPLCRCARPAGRGPGVYARYRPAR